MYVTVLNNYPAEKALSNVKCEPGISSCGQLGRECRTGMRWSSSVLLKGDRSIFRIAVGGGEKSNMHEWGA